MSNSSTKEKITKLTVTAVLLALGTVLSLIKVFEMPFGGSITLLSMVPVCLISVFYGTSYSVLPCMLYGAIQMFLGGVFGWGLSPAVLIGCIMLDYIAAFGMLAVSGIFKHHRFGIVSGVALACFLRFLCHFASGIILWTNFDYFNSPWLYSLCYNGFYMLPEMLITCIGVYLLSRNKAITRLVKATSAE